MPCWVKKELARLNLYNTRRLLPPPPLNLLPPYPISPTFSQVEGLVIEADLRCASCQKRVAETISRIDDIESMVVHIGEKKVTVVSKSAAAKDPSTKVANVYNIWAAAKPSKV